MTLAPQQEYKQVLEQFEFDVQEGIESAYLGEGYVGDEGEPSEEAMRFAAYDIFADRCIVKSKAERSRKALTQGEFYSLVFPSGPGAGEESPDLDPVAESVLKKLSSTVWGLTQTSRSGHLQRQLEAHDTTMVLCRCKVYRHADPRQAVYATDNEGLIMEDAVDKEIQSLVRRASSLRRDLSMIVERHPKLQTAVTDRLGVELNRVNAELALDTGESKNGSNKELAAASAS
jgi:hypothetical protein